VKRNRELLNSISTYVITLALGIFLAMILVTIVGENPLKVLKILVLGSMGGSKEIAYSLFYATPFIFTGLSVAWAFRAGLFNVGAEGQMLMGGIAVVALGILCPSLPMPLAIFGSFIAAFVVGGLWGAIAGWVKVKRGAHEVLVTILLNFVAYGLSSFFILNVFRNPASQNPETFEIGSNYFISQMSFLDPSSPLNQMIFVALFCAIIFSIVFRKTLFGFFQRMSGAAPELAVRSGVLIDRQVILALFISGGLAGLASCGTIMGYSHKAREGFANGAGFIGIAVALLGQNRAGGVVLSAILFGALAKGSLDLDLDTQFVTRDLAQVIQACIVVVVASKPGLELLYKKYRGSRT
jgi:ABC-type uncharacterized transport system permease subunit